MFKKLVDLVWEEDSPKDKTVAAKPSLPKASAAMGAVPAIPADDTLEKFSSSVKEVSRLVPEERTAYLTAFLTLKSALGLTKEHLLDCVKKQQSALSERLALETEDKKSKFAIEEMERQEKITELDASLSELLKQKAEIETKLQEVRADQENCTTKLAALQLAHTDALQVLTADGAAKREALSTLADKIQSYL